MSPLFFKWLTGKEDSLGLNDFEVIEPELYHSLQTLSKYKPEEFKDLETVSLFKFFYNKHAYF